MLKLIRGVMEIRWKSLYCGRFAANPRFSAYFITLHGISIYRERKILSLWAAIPPVFSILPVWFKSQRSNEEPLDRMYDIYPHFITPHLWSIIRERKINRILTDVPEASTRYNLYFSLFVMIVVSRGKSFIELVSFCLLVEESNEHIRAIVYLSCAAAHKFSSWLLMWVPSSGREYLDLFYLILTGIHES